MGKGGGGLCFTPSRVGSDVSRTSTKGLGVGVVRFRSRAATANGGHVTVTGRLGLNGLLVGGMRFGLARKGSVVLNGDLLHLVPRFDVRDRGLMLVRRMRDFAGTGRCPLLLVGCAFYFHSPSSSARGCSVNGPAPCAQGVALRSLYGDDNGVIFSVGSVGLLGVG